MWKDDFLEPRVQTLRDRIIRSKPTVSIHRPKYYTESMKQTENEPMILRHARALAHVLENIPVKILAGELVVGAIVEKAPGATIYPEGVGLRVIPELENLRSRHPRCYNITDEEIRILKEEIDPYWINRSMSAYVEHITPEKVLDRLYGGAASSFILTEIAGMGHVSINYPKLLSLGFKKIGEMAEEKIREYETVETSNPEAIDGALFYRSAKIVSEGIAKFAQRYVEKAEEMVKNEKGSQREEELERIIDTCKWVPAKPPRNFHEAVQFVWFVQLALSLETYDGQAISMGRMDQYLYPYYMKDLQAGILDQESAIELIECLWIKINELVPIFDSTVELFFGGLLNTQAVTLSGMNENGEDTTNGLTYAILEATRRAALPVPNVHIRIHRKSPAKLLKTLAKIIASGTNNVAAFNDEIIVKSLTRKNIPLEEARDYATVGCVELAPFGTSFTSSDAALFNIALCLDLALSNGESLMLGQKIGPETGNPLEFKSIDDVIEAFRKQLAYFVRLMAVGSNCFETANMVVKPTPFLSLCVEDCFKAGKDITTGSARYNFTGVQGVGMADVADSLAALDQLVFKEKKISMGDLLEALRKNFEGSEELRQLLVNRSPKYGDDEELPDKYAQLVTKIYSEEVEKHQNIRNGWFIPGMYSVTAHVPFGYVTGALPSGRMAGEPISNGASPAIGSGKKGLTAAIKSAAKVDYTLIPNGMAFTLNLDPNIVSGEEGTDILASMIKTYAELGGMQIHFNVVDSETLREAQKCPEAYRNLVVRVAGYSAYFVDLAEDVQDEIIKRYKGEL